MRWRDRRAAKRFFRKALKATHAQSPRVINVDKNERLPPAIDELKAAKILTQFVELRQNKYLNNLVEQDHRFIKKLVNKSLGFQTFYTARRTLKSYETMNSIRKGQLQGVSRGDILGQAENASENFWSCCIIPTTSHRRVCSLKLFATEPNTLPARHHLLQHYL